jgi:esterase/lipase superfamily enzyme
LLVRIRRTIMPGMSPVRRRILRVSSPLLALVTILAGACTSRLAPAPNLYVQNDPAEAFGDVPPAHRTRWVSVLYGTNRLPVRESDDAIRYGADRSRILDVGMSSARLGRDLTWEQLVEASTSRQRRGDMEVAFGGTTRVVSFPATPEPRPALGLDEDVTVVDLLAGSPATQRAAAAVHELLARELESRPRREVLVVIHGFNMDLGTTVVWAGELGHYLGHEMLPVVFSWPAGKKGVFGYAQDYESGRFSVHHLKRFLHTIITAPSVDRVHVLAHSRGTDVFASAMRELVLYLRGRGVDLRATMKLGHVILAAADIDVDFVDQRITAEHLEEACERLTIYAGGRDQALSISDDMLGSRMRLGQAGTREIPDYNKRLLLHEPRLNLIVAPYAGGSFGHTYVIDDPAVLSDVVLLLRYDCAPGAEHGRPLERDPAGFWVLPRGYPGEIGLPARVGDADTEP